MAYNTFMSLPTHPILMVNGKQTWLAVLNVGSNLQFSLSSKFNTPFTILHRRKKQIVEEMGRFRDAGRIVVGTVQRVLLI